MVHRTLTCFSVWANLVWLGWLTDRLGSWCPALLPGHSSSKFSTRSTRVKQNWNWTGIRILNFSQGIRESFRAGMRVCMPVCMQREKRRAEFDQGGSPAKNPIRSCCDELHAMLCVCSTRTHTTCSLTLDTSTLKI